MQDSKKPGCLYAARFCQGRDSGYSCNTPVRKGSPKMQVDITRNGGATWGDPCRKGARQDILCLAMSLKQWGKALPKLYR